MTVCVFFRALFKKGKREHLAKRLGLSLPKKYDKNKVIWIHAISLGETKSSRLFISEIKKRFPGTSIVLSSVTETGHEEAKKIPEVDLAFIMPLDLSWNISRLFKRIRPKMLILIETDFWLNTFRIAKKREVPLLLVSGKISKKSVSRFQKTPRFTKRLFSYFDLLCLQNKTYRSRFLKLGIDPKKAIVTGNLKYDQKTPYLDQKALQDWREKLGIFDDDRVITIACTHAPEEKQVLNELQKLWDKDISCKVLLAPRHPDRFIHVANILREEKVPFIELSRLHLAKNTEKVVLIDTMGFLPICYQLSECAVIGGSYQSKVGGHNILEPNFYALPVFFGPHMNTQEDLKKMVVGAKSGAHLPMKRFAETLETFFEDTEKQKKMQESARNLISSLKGRVNDTFDAILSFFP